MYFGDSPPKPSVEARLVLIYWTADILYIRKLSLLAKMLEMKTYSPSLPIFDGDPSALWEINHHLRKVPFLFTSQPRPVESSFQGLGNIIDLFGRCLAQAWAQDENNKAYWSDFRCCSDSALPLLFIDVIILQRKRGFKLDLVVEGK